VEVEVANAVVTGEATKKARISPGLKDRVLTIEAAVAVVVVIFKIKEEATVELTIVAAGVMARAKVVAMVTDQVEVMVKDQVEVMAKALGTDTAQSQVEATAKDQVEVMTKA